MTTIRALILMVIVMAGFAAWVFRYEPMETQVGGAPLVWDRWDHRICAVWAGGRFNCFDNQAQ